jgi:hypothetical protein
MKAIKYGMFAKVGITLIIVAGALSAGYLIGAKRQAAVVQPGKLLVQVYSSGGYVTSECLTDCLELVQVYDSGQIYGRTRGNFTSVITVRPDEVVVLQKMIETTKIEDVFVKNKSRFCPSSLDAIDVDIVLSLPNGQRRSYSNCDYQFVDEHPLLQHIYNLEHQIDVKKITARQ